MLLVAAVIVSTTLNAQDLITKKDGTDVPAKVLEINVDDIKYKRMDNLNGPTFTMLKSDILMIRYENGTKDIFANEPAKTAAAPKKTAVNQVAEETAQTDKADPYKSRRPRVLLYNSLYKPMGEWYGENGNLGYNLGFEGIVPLGTQYINFIAGYNFGYNGASYRDDDDNYYEWGYLQSWTTIGLRGQGHAGQFAFYGSLLTGANATTLTGDLSDYEKGYALAYGWNTGVIIAHKLNIGIRYLVAHPYFDHKDDYEDRYDEKLKNLNICVGIEL